ncbi:MAG: tRNA epoxyqueuosine(34) reductase QueG [Verrucomicrobiales bacterium]|nr:tRNA epoxyqueuosine(34) reductase QueG [Verrucomicrobiales bacterium]
MKARIVARAAELGFDLCGICEARRSPHGEAFRQWLAEGCHGGMAYLERTAAKREDPQLVLEGARSAVVLAVSYHDDAAVEGGLDTSPRGVVARYARHRDYHDLLLARVLDLSRFMGELGGSLVRSLGYIDTGPVLERDLGQRAGIGFVGKHTNLISRRLGNWFLIAEILTTLELEPDPPEHNRCGTCTRCLTACPTSAITRPFRLDARRCISYLTIENKGPIPEEFRRAIGARIFGCDDCLAACPWNRFARVGRMLNEHQRVDLEAPDLLDLLQLDQAEFKRRFSETPLSRPKRRGLLRNVCVALGNVGGRESLGPLERAAADPEPLIAEHAAWAIGEIERRIGSRSRGVCS